MSAVRAGSSGLRLLVVDDHPVVRAGIVALLSAETDLEVVAELDDGAAVPDAFDRLAPDLVLMDLRMPGVDGVEATTRLRARHPGARVLVLTTYDTDADILRAVEAGATGYLLKDAPRADLSDAVRRAARGETVLAPPVAARLLTRLRAPAAERLTARETEVLAAVARGLSNAGVAAELFIGEATVKSHLLRVFAKLGVDDRTAAVTVAMSRGLLPPPV
ncbi:response regulator [Kineococcus gynurae]|uniref:Response regulator n=1 Tax=Kineococcus gynurae TaxID=452979 RepID=A0ABV5LN69_9ACTN